MSGGKGGSTTSSVQIPAWAEQAAQRNIQRADQLSQIGYVPYYGPDVAAFSPMQQASFASTNTAAQAFGLPSATSSLTGMPAPQNFGGIQAYSSAPLYEQSLQELRARRPGQYAAMTAPFINPFTGAQPMSPFGSLITPQAAASVDYRVRTGSGDSGGDGADSQPIGGLSQSQQAAVDAAVEASRRQLEDRGIDPNSDYGRAYLDQSRRLNTADVRGADLRGGYFENAGQAGLAGMRVPPVTNDAIAAEAAYWANRNAQAGIPPSVTVAGQPAQLTREPARYDGQVLVSMPPVTLPPAQLTREPAPYDGGGYAGLTPFETDEIALQQIESGLFQGPFMPGMNPYADTSPASMQAPGFDVAPIGPIMNPAIAPQPPSSGSDDNDYGMTFGTPLSPADDIASMMAPPSNDKDNGGGNGGGGCVIATHAVESGAFTPSMKREAVVWCMHALHGKWWGEAIRRGYRHLGNQKIQAGKAREHYDEFRRYVDFASGKRRDLKGALTFITRTAQFFVVGLVHKEA